MEVLRAEFWRKIWNSWELRAMVVFTLAVQIVLVFFGQKRKSSYNLKLRIAVWSAYLTADSVATVALGVLSSKLGDVNERNGGRLGYNDKLLAFWSPLLLILLGGPDTITSYSLEDNALWLRHCLGLAVQTSATTYIIFMAWTSSYLSYLSSVMALVGLVKYGERVCALWMASNDMLKQSMLAPPDPSPNYPRFMEEYTLKQAEGYYVVADEVIEVQVPEGIHSNGDDLADDSEVIVKSYDLLQMFKCLFVELILSHDERNTSKSIFKAIDPVKAFRIVEIELGFIYDLLHTKAMVLYTKWGIRLRLFTFSSTLLVLVLFSWAKKLHLSRVDLYITYLLLAVIVFLETYSILMLVSSDWSNIWLRKHNKSRALRRAVNFVRLPRQPRWSHSIAQFSLLSFCTKERPLVCHNVVEFLKINEKLEKYHYTLHEDVSDEIRNWIFKHIKDEFLDVEERHAPVPIDIHESLAKLLKDYLLDQVTWSTKGELDQIVLNWHIATELSYYSDREKGWNESKLPHFRTSFLLSRYMFYLLVMYPSMLPSGIGEIRLRDTFAEAFNFFKDHRIPNSGSNQQPYRWMKNLMNDRGNRNENNPHLQRATKMLLEVSTEVPPSKVKGGKSKSVLFDGCMIVAAIRDRETSIKWETIGEFWVKILMYAASQCRGDRHAGQLRRGGELLTHVWLMMAHFGLTDHFKMTQGQAIAKLILRQAFVRVMTNTYSGLVHLDRH
ncbi:uncharacterized protein LOC115681446 [Syzygium oleosum]|uniref:uncharacterized protein LOC115681446 n=1 Tax=Syzygium oleosum TaxID=219896 RepID=UPI0024B9BB6F|nr:uncharacterized protein LOC115681446 [Syzygium oleosum]